MKPIHNENNCIYAMYDGETVYKTEKKEFEHLMQETYKGLK